MPTRQDLEQLILNNIPDNNSKFISAALLREVLNRINSDKFHLSEDELRNQIYQATQTLEQRLQGLPIERRATIGPYNWEPNVGTVNISIIKDPEDIIVGATRTRVNSVDLYIDIEFAENITEKSIDTFWRFPNNQNLPNERQLLPGPIVQLVDPVATNKIRLYQTRRDVDTTGDHAIEIILK